MTTLFIRHSNGAIISWIGISITWVKEIESFFREIKPSVLIKIFCIIFSNLCLEITLPCCDHFVKGFCGRSEVIWIIESLFMKIHVHLRKPFIILADPGLGFFLSLPSPIAIKIEIVMICSASRPGFAMLATLSVWIKFITHY